MDWGAALGGMDDQLKNILVRNKMSQDNQLNVLKSGVDIQNVVADNARADQAQADTTAYRKQDIDLRNRQVKRLEDLDANKEQDQAELNALTSAWAAMPEGPEKMQAGALLSTRIKGFKNTGAVLSVITDPVTHEQKLVNLGAKGPNDQVITPKQQGGAGGPEMEISDDMAQLMADAVRGGDRHAMDLLGRAGNYNAAARQKVLNLVTGSPLPKDYSLAEAFAGNKADANILGKIDNSIAQQEVLRNATQQNFGVMMKTMEKIPDWGSPAFNVAPRYIAANIIAPADMKAFQMARASALREYVRLIGSNLDAKGQIHQSTQDAYEKLLNDDTPMSAMVSAIQVMNADMDNLKGSLESEKATVQKSIKDRGKAPEVGKPAPVSNSATVTMGANGAPDASLTQFPGFPPLTAAPPNSKGKVSPAVVNALALKFGKKPEEAAAYFAASGYDVNP